VDYLGITKLLVQFPGQLRLFLAGIFIYLLFNKINKINIYPLLLIGLSLSIFFIQYKYFKFTIYPLSLSILVVYIAYFVKNIKINFDFSYSFYILHFPIIQLSLYFKINPSNPILSFLSLFFVILVLSYFSEKYIEKKFIKMGKNIVRKNKNNDTK
jgi:peptidoglycan/LPS O-acetylase OafA/YrhL